MTDHEQAQPGWYPTGDGFQRYWDGSRWTEHQAPMAQQPNQGYPVAAGYGAAASNETGVAVLAHLGGAFFSFLVPLVIYLMKKDESPFLRHHSAEALNFHITVFIAVIVSFLLVFVLIGILLLPLVVVGSWVLTIVASIAANRGEWYRYPLTIRMIT